MVCESINLEAYSKNISKYTFRTCSKNELYIWKTIHYDTKKEKEKNLKFMDKYFDEVYTNREEQFYDKCTFICSKDNKNILGTGFI